MLTITCTTNATAGDLSWSGYSVMLRESKSGLALETIADFQMIESLWSKTRGELQGINCGSQITAAEVGIVPMYEPEGSCGSGDLVIESSWIAESQAPNLVLLICLSSRLSRYLQVHPGGVGMLSDPDQRP